MMYGDFGSGAGVLMLFVVLFWLALIVLIVWLVTKVWPSGGRAEAVAPRSSATAPSTTESPELILDRMFALGEIDEATYRTRRTALAEMKQQS